MLRKSNGVRARPRVAGRHLLENDLLEAIVVPPTDLHDDLPKAANRHYRLPHRQAS